MALYPKAVLKLLPENKTARLIDPDQAILHSAVDAPGPTSLYGYLSRTDVTLESTFYVRWDGTVEQYMDTCRQADANRYANPRAISIETEDDGDPNSRPWSAAQVEALVELLEWICRTHPKVLRRQCPAWDQAGIGWHTMWGAPSPWTPAAGKTCPGTARIPQAKQIIARIAGQGEDDMYDQDARNELVGRLDYLVSAMTQVHPAVAAIRVGMLDLQSRPADEGDADAIAALVPNEIAEAVIAKIKEKL